MTFSSAFLNSRIFPCLPYYALYLFWISLYIWEPLPFFLFVGFFYTILKVSVWVGVFSFIVSRTSGQQDVCFQGWSGQHKGTFIRDRQILDGESIHSKKIKWKKIQSFFLLNNHGLMIVPMESLLDIVQRIDILDEWKSWIKECIITFHCQFLQMDPLCSTGTSRAKARHIISFPLHNCCRRLWTNTKGVEGSYFKGDSKSSSVNIERYFMVFCSGFWHED